MATRLKRTEKKAQTGTFRHKKQAARHVKKADRVAKRAGKRGNTKLRNRAVGVGDIAHDALMNDFEQPNTRASRKYSKKKAKGKSPMKKTTNPQRKASNKSKATRAKKVGAATKAGLTRVKKAWSSGGGKFLKSAENKKLKKIEASGPKTKISSKPRKKRSATKR